MQRHEHIFYVITLKNWSENKNQQFYLLKGFFAFMVEMIIYRPATNCC